MAVDSAGANLVDIIAAPSLALARLRERPSAWFALLLLAGATTVFWFWYFLAVDFDWLLEQLIAAETAQSPPDQAMAIRQGITAFGRIAYGVLFSLAALAALLFATLVNAAYLTVVSSVRDDPCRFRHWFALTVWSSVPLLFAIAGMALNFALEPAPRLTPDALNPLSLHNLLGLAANHPLAAPLGALDLTTLWTCGLLVLGYRRWTRRRWLDALATVLAPFLLFFGIWTVWALL